MLAGAQDTKFAEIGRQIVAAALGDQQPAISASVEDSANPGGGNRELSAAEPLTHVSDGSAAGGEATKVAAVSNSFEDEYDTRGEHSNTSRTRFTEVPGAGHAVHVERPEAVASLLAKWLAGDAS